MFDHRYFHPHFSELAAQYTLIYVDLRGRYMSDESVAQKCHIGQDLEDLEDIRVQLGIQQWDVLGHSFGGFIALLYASLYPQSIKSLVVVSTPMGITKSQEESNSAELLHHFKHVTTREENLEALLTLNFHTKPIEKDIAYLRQALLAYDSYDKFTVLKENYLPQSEEILEKYLEDGEEMVKNTLMLNVPLYVTASKHDAVGFWKETNQFMQNKHSQKHSQIHLFENSSHFPWIEETNKFMNVVKEWLKY